jgi:hypothetical protein
MGAAARAAAACASGRDCERLVRTKLLSRKLGFGPARTAAAQQSISDGQQQRHQTDVAALLSATVLSSPGGLSSPAHRAEIDALIEQHLDNLVSRLCQRQRYLLMYLCGCKQLAVKAVPAFRTLHASMLQGSMSE